MYKAFLASAWATSSSDLQVSLFYGLHFKKIMEGIMNFGFCKSPATIKFSSMQVKSSGIKGLNVTSTALKILEEFDAF